MEKIRNEEIELSSSVEESVVQMSYDWWWFNEAILAKLSKEHRIEEILLWKRLTEYSEDIHIQKFIEVLNESKLNQKNIKRKYSEDSQKLHQEIEFEFYSLIEKLGVINDYVALPLERKILCKETFDIINTIINSGWKITIWANSYFVPWSLHVLKKLYSRLILEPKNVEIKFWNWVNIQENIGIIKAECNWHDNYQSLNKFEVWVDIIDNIHIHIEDNTSMAHWCNIYWNKKENWNYEIKLHAWKWVFLGINSVIWSGCDFWDNTVIWWWSKVWLWVKTWRNVIIGTQSNIKDNLIIPENCIILDWSHINEWFEIISYEDYKKNEVDYDMEKTNSKWKRNFVIKLSNKKEERLKQIEWLWDTYLQMRKFNKSKVIPENKAFAIIDSMLCLINNKFESLEIVKNLNFENSRSQIEIDYYSNWTVDASTNKTSEIYIQAYPKDKIKFILEDLVYILESVFNKTQINLKSISDLLSYPQIPANYEEIFLWYNSLIGNANIWDDKTNFIYECSWRKDENSLTDKSNYDRIQFSRCVFHGPGNQIITDTKWFRSCFHWNIIAKNSVIWEKWYPSTFNNISFNDSIIKWRCTMNNASISDSEINFAVIISATPDKKVIIENWTMVAENSTIRWNNTISWCKIYKYSFIWEWPKREIQKDSSLKWFFGIRLK